MSRIDWEHVVRNDDYCRHCGCADRYTMTHASDCPDRLLPRMVPSPDRWEWDLR